MLVLKLLRLHLMYIKYLLGHSLDVLVLPAPFGFSQGVITERVLAKRSFVTLKELPQYSARRPSDDWKSVIF